MRRAITISTLVKLRIKSENTHAAKKYAQIPFASVRVLDGTNIVPTPKYIVVVAITYVTAAAG